MRRLFPHLTPMIHRESALQLTKQEHDDVVYSGNYKIADSSLFHSSRFLVFTMRKFQIFINQKSALKNQYSWIDLTDVMNRDSQITLVFGNINVKINRGPKDPIIEALKDILPRILLSDFARWFSPDVKFPLPTPASVLARFYEIVERNLTVFSQADITEFERLIIYKQSHLDLTTKTPKQCEVFYGLLQFFDVKYLKCYAPPHTKRHFSIIDTSSFSHDFKEFSELNTDGYIFSNCEIGDDEFDSIAEILHPQIHLMGFHQTIFSDHLYLFLQHAKIQILDLSNTLKLDLEMLFPRIGHVRYLSLSNCQLQISSVFFLISKMANLRCIDLSLNYADEPVDLGNFYPRQLHKLILNDIRWGNLSFASTIGFILRHAKNLLDLSLARANASTEEYTTLFHSLKSTNANCLRSLIWDENVIHDLFFVFLNHHRYLTELSLNGCFHEFNPQPIQSFAHFLRCSKIQKLSVRGTSLSYLGKSAPILFAAVKEIHLQFLDISDSRCGGSGVSLYDLLNVETVVIDGLHPDKDDISRYIKHLTFLCSNAHVSYPENDFAENWEALGPYKAPLFEKAKIEGVGSVFDQDLTIFHYEPEPLFPYEYHQELLQELVPIPGQRTSGSAAADDDISPIHVDLAQPKTRRKIRPIPDGQRRSIHKAESLGTDLKPVTQTREAFKAGRKQVCSMLVNARKINRSPK